MDYKSEIVKKIHEMAKYYSAHQVFRDWIEVFALSIANFCEHTGTPVWEERAAVLKYNRKVSKTGDTRIH